MRRKCMRKKILGIVSFVFVVLFALSNVACSLSQSLQLETLDSILDSGEEFLSNEDKI